MVPSLKKVAKKSVPMETARLDIPWAQVMSFGSGLSNEQPVAGQARSVLVESSRAKKLAGLQITHYKCLSCRKLLPMGENKCSECGYQREEGGTFAVQERGRERAALRQTFPRGCQTLRARRSGDQPPAPRCPRSLRSC